MIENIKGNCRPKFRLVSLLLLICAIVALSGCEKDNSSSGSVTQQANSQGQTQNPTNATNSTQKWLDYENEKYDVRFTYPSDWVLAENEQDGFLSVGLTSGLSTFILSVALGEDPLLLDYSYEEMLESWLTIYPDASYKNVRGEHDNNVRIYADVTYQNKALSFDYTGWNDEYFYSIAIFYEKANTDIINKMWDSVEYYYDYEGDDNSSAFDSDSDIADLLVVSDFKIDRSIGSIAGAFTFTLSSELEEDYKAGFFLLLYDADGVMLGEGSSLGPADFIIKSGTKVKYKGDFVNDDDIAYVQLIARDSSGVTTSEQWVFTVE